MSIEPFNDTVPAQLYKYISSARISLLNEGLIRFTQPGDLNDPFEIRPVLTRIASDAETSRHLETAARAEFRKRFGPQVTDDQILTLAKRAVSLIQPRIAPFIGQAMKGAMEVINNKVFPEGFNKAFGVMSLSENPQSSLMWAHYGESYQGIILELDTQSEFFKCPDGMHEDFGRVRKVIYSDRRPAFDFSVEEVPSMEFLYTKPREWAYEAEWRMLRPLDRATKIIDHGPFSVNLFSIPPGAITSIILGFRISKNHFENVVAALETSPLLKGASLKAVRPGNATFGLEIIPVSSWEQLNADATRSNTASQELVAALMASNALADVLGPSLGKKFCS